jgi:hypothetical protein
MHFVGTVFTTFLLVVIASSLTATVKHTVVEQTVVEQLHEDASSLTAAAEETAEDQLPDDISSFRQLQPYRVHRPTNAPRRRGTGHCNKRNLWHGSKSGL